jgi:2-(1,2-epoxy-1,2-dihydrophenyl)acetyl-CoA isomerase
MSDDPILYELSDGIATLTLNRPDRMNALGSWFLGAMHAALDRVIADGARVVLINARGRGFCSGADLIEGLPDDLGQLVEEKYNPVMQRLIDLPIPVIAAVNGAAAGAGCALALSADLVVAAEDSYFLLAFANIGLVPDCGATWLVANALGRARALEMMLLGEKIPATKAQDWGLIHKVVPNDALQDEARALAARLAKGPTTAYGLIRRSVGKALAGTYEQALAQEILDQRAAGNSRDSREAIAAFVEKRKPVFQGK